MNGMGRLGGLNIIEVGAVRMRRSYLQLFAFYKKYKFYLIIYFNKGVRKERCNYGKKELQEGRDVGGYLR